MSIIDQIKESPRDSAVIAKFEGLARMGRLSEKQIAYGKSLIAGAVKAETARLAQVAELDAIKDGEWIDTIYGEALVTNVYTNIDGDRTALIDLMTATPAGETSLRVVLSNLDGILA